MTQTPKAADAPRVSLLAGRITLTASLVGAVAIGVVAAWFGHWGWGVLGGLAFLVVSSSTLAWLATPPSPPPRHDPSALERDFAEILRDLDAVREDVRRRVRRRALLIVPAGGALALGAWLLFDWLAGIHDRPDALFTTPFAGGFFAFYLAAGRPAAEYARLYRARILPRIAATFGDLTYVLSPKPDIASLKRFHVFRDFDKAVSSDAIVGTRRGVRVSIRQLDLLRRKGLFDHEAVFRGVLVEATLRNRLLGVTGVGADEGLLGHWRDSLSTEHGVRRVGLEDPKFEREYEVWSTDQVMARALVTPAFMERLRALSHLRGYGKPFALAQDSQLTIILPRSATDGLFVTPSYEKPASNATVLVDFQRDVKALLRAADAVIDLDDETARAAAEAR